MLGDIFVLAKTEIENFNHSKLSTDSIVVSPLCKQIHKNRLKTISDNHVELTKLTDIVRIVKCCSLMRQFVVCLEDTRLSVSNLGVDTPYNDILEIHEESHKEISDLLLNCKKNDFIHIYSGLEDVLTNIILGKKKVGIVLDKFPNTMSALGGSIRRGSVTVVSAKYKQGKSSLSLAVAEEAAKKKIPVLYIDTEMTREYVSMRLLAKQTDIPLKHFEYGTFANDPESYNKAFEWLKKTNSDVLPICHISVSGQDISDIIHTIRRFVTTKIKYNPSGQSNDCLIVVDYLKITNQKEFLKQGIKEWEIIFGVMSNIYDLSVQLDIPVVLAAQLNEQGNVAASSRLNWVCSNRLIIESKTQLELAKFPNTGNKKIYCPFNRYGEPMQDGDYIHFNHSFVTGEWTEYDYHSQIIKQHTDNNVTNSNITNSNITNSNV